MEKSLDIKFRKMLSKFLKENDINFCNPEMQKIFKKWFEMSTQDFKNDNRFEKDFNEQTEAYQKLKIFQDSIIKQCIDFINNNEDVQEMIETKRNEVYNKWNPEGSKFIIEPDIRMYFGIDHLNDSLKTESSITLQVGNAEVLNIV